MRLRTIGLISTLFLGLLAGPLPTEAQQAGKVYRIVFLGGGSPYDAFRQGLRELGYVDGQDLVIERRSMRGGRERWREIVAELVRLKVDVIVLTGRTSVIRALKQATRTIPIVMRGVMQDPVKAGYVVSLARPGGNITGLSNLESKMHPKRLELLKKAFPRISRVAIFWPPGQEKAAIQEIQAVAQAWGIQI